MGSKQATLKELIAAAKDSEGTPQVRATVTLVFADGSRAELKTTRPQSVASWHGTLGKWIAPALRLQERSELDAEIVPPALPGEETGA